MSDDSSGTEQQVEPSPMHAFHKDSIGYKNKVIPPPLPLLPKSMAISEPVRAGSNVQFIRYSYLKDLNNVIQEKIGDCLVVKGKQQSDGGERGACPRVEPCAPESSIREMLIKEIKEPVNPIIFSRN